jgi:hypothetical protein
VNKPVGLKRLSNDTHIRDLKVAATAAKTVAITYRIPHDGVAVANVLDASNDVYKQTGYYWDRVKRGVLYFAVAACVVAAVAGAAFTGGASLAILAAASVIALSNPIQKPDEKIPATQIAADKVSEKMHAFVKNAKIIIKDDLKLHKAQGNDEFQPGLPRPQR